MPFFTWTNALGKVCNRCQFSKFYLQPGITFRGPVLCRNTKARQSEPVRKAILCVWVVWRILKNASFPMIISGNYTRSRGSLCSTACASVSIHCAGPMHTSLINRSNRSKSHLYCRSEIACSHSGSWRRRGVF